MPCPNTENLDNAQKDMMARIIGAGQSRGFSDQMIDYALKSAFIESSLGNNMGAPYAGSTSVGLFQYNSTTWSDLGHTSIGDRNNVDHQINAFYNDINKYTTRYYDLTPDARGNLSLEQYLYVKHHDGNNYTDFPNSPGKAIFDSTCFEPETETPNRDGENDNGGAAGSGGYGGSGAYWPTPSGWGFDDLPTGTVTLEEIPPGEDGDGE